MASWGDGYRNVLESRYAALDGEAFRARFAWMDELHARGRAALDPKRLETMPPQEVYRAIESLNVPQCPVRVTNLGRMNQAADVTAALWRLATMAGDFEAKYRAAKIPQAGLVTLSELLCVSQPARFALRNTAFAKALAKVVPFYTRRAVEELPYPEYLDLCRELARVQEDWLAPRGLRTWAEDRRFLLLHAVLVGDAPG